MYNYQSDTTKFLNEYLEKNPAQTKIRLQHHGLLWDVELNPEDEANFAAASVPQKGYPYEIE